MKIALRTTALAYLAALVLVPLGMILFRTFEDGFVAFWESVTTPASISAISMSLTIVAIVVPLNVVFGVAACEAVAQVGEDLHLALAEQVHRLVEHVRAVVRQ